MTFVKNFLVFVWVTAWLIWGFGDRIDWCWIAVLFVTIAGGWHWSWLAACFGGHS